MLWAAEVLGLECNRFEGTCAEEGVTIEIPDEEEAAVPVEIFVEDVIYPVFEAEASYSFDWSSGFVEI